LSESQLRGIVAAIFLVSQIGTLCLAFLFYIWGGFKFPELTTTLAIVGPLIGVQAAAIVKYIVAHRDVASMPLSDPKQTLAFSLLSVSIPIVFVLAINGMVVLRGYNRIRDFDDFKILLSVLDGTFGAYVGLIVLALFQSNSQKQ
jgi:hypothetical protein